MRVLVTGAAGFVGSHVVDALVAAGHEVLALDRTDEWLYYNPAAERVVVDLNDLDAMRHWVRGVDAVSHQAAMVGLGVDFADVDDYARDNDLGTASLLRGLHEAAFSGRVVLASSMVVYGEGRYRCLRHGVMRPPPRTPADLDAGRFDPRCASCDEPLVPEPVSEDARVDPRNVYAATKLHQEHLCAAYGREHDAVVVALRYHNVYGPRMPRNTLYAGVAALFVSALRRGDAPQVFEDGGQLRDFVHVTDVAEANVLALTVDVGASGAFNIATGCPRSVLDLAERLAAFIGAGQRPAVTGRWRPGDVRHVFASPWLAEKTLGFQARVSFADGMADFAANQD